ncbi:MAG: toxic anion resistance protein [Anaerofustis stercorihominis]|nr:toxic anion resistance protein [Anaerofustis stercorihominis]
MDLLAEFENIPQPTLTLDIDTAEELKSVEVMQEVAVEVKEEDITAPPVVKYTDEEMKMIEEFSEKIDVTNANIVLSYGSGAQKNISKFSETALNKVRTKDLGSVGGLLSDLVVELKNFGEEEDKGFFDFFKKSKSKIEKMMAEYDDAEANVEKIVEVLENHQVTLLKDIAMFGKMYELNMAYYKELGMYIEAGKMRLDYVRNTVIPEMKAKAEQSGLTEDAQAVNDMSNAALQFEKRLHDLELTRTVSIQMGPQIRLIQNNDSMMVDKINSTLVNTIPLWKSQMIIALGLENSRSAMQAQREVNDVTNELLKKNADMLKSSTVEIAKESERGIVDIETLTYTNEKLVSTLDEILKIQDEGSQKRIQAQQELTRIEDELRKKLLEIR